ncbi:efflux transporter outer membrane subunit [Altererythrobacter sp. RZ02]|uniref:Efflux transporter outer membrane subunit n=1 Tax=Pontixanthobacter rizhaonensis TaxID=2730337 RepID=A0A848QNE8_9SPHN|nr:efflux transporter outer membrane subunit [Pontixanthobacter rizhaonensis]NMW30618.1 efflux transporter outer membrane subunit [Pontixanthobacter rizhaonensis]
MGVTAITARASLAKRCLFCAASAAALSGCATGLTNVEPAVSGIAVPQSWATETVPIETDIDQYWQLLGDPLLSEFVDQAVQQNLDIAQAAGRLAQARAGLKGAQARRLPQLSATGGARRDVGDFANTDVLFSGGLDASWEADLFGQISNSVTASRADLAAAGYSLGDVQRLVIGNVALSTIAARSTAVQLAIARDTLANQNENLQIAEWRNQAGLVSSLDVEQARVQQAQTAASIPAFESDLASTANAISTLIGEPPGRVLSLLRQEAAIPAPPMTVGFSAPAEVLRRRPDVRGAESALLANSARINIARAQLLPMVRLTGNLGSSSRGIGNLFDVITGNLFASVGQLIFDGGQARSQIDSAEATAQISLAAWQQTILRALEDVESSAVDLDASRERVAILAQAQEAAGNAAILARSQYQAGLIDFQFLLTSENQLLSARNALAAAQAQRASAFVRLTQALGGGWTETGTPTPQTPPAEGNTP